MVGASRISKSLQHSLLIHFCFLGLILGLLLFQNWRSHRTPDWEVIDIRVSPPRAVNVPLQISEAPPPPATPPARKVFGVSRNAVTTDSASAASVKLGNTVATPQDNLKLGEDDATNLPIPTDEFLVTQMPRRKLEVRADYPEVARKQGIEGVVEMDLLIDREGRVRDVKVVRGIGFGLDESAVRAVEQMLFEPARVENEPVAVRIRYGYRFELRRP